MNLVYFADEESCVFVLRIQCRLLNIIFNILLSRETAFLNAYGPQAMSM
jgi:hypothetical protein